MPKTPGATAYGHAHAEAFCLMKYASKDGSVVEMIWNSRDGVTPFVVSKDGVEMQHVEWQNDRYLPFFHPAVGSRVFVDLTSERAKEGAKANAARFWETYPPSRDQFSTVDDLAEMLEKEYLKDVGSGAPDLIVVTEEWLIALSAQRGS